MQVEYSFRKKLKTMIYLNNMKIHAILATIIITTTNIVKADLILAVTYSNENASDIKMQYGGSGLGYTSKGGYTLSGNNTAVSPSPHCCSPSCYCGHLSKVKDISHSLTMHLAVEQKNYSSGGFTGNITEATLNEVKAHELRHVAIRQYAANRSNKIMLDDLKQIKSTPKKQDSDAQNSVLALAPPFIGIWEVAYGYGAAYSEDLDNYEAAGVDQNGVWRESPSATAMQIIEKRIDQLSNNYQLPTDSSASDCLGS